MPPGDGLPPQVRMPLLDYITSTSMDADYAHVAARRGGSAETVVRPGIAALVVTGLFGLLVATAALQTSRHAADAQTGRESLVQQIETRSSVLDARRQRVRNLREEVVDLEARRLATTNQERTVTNRLNRLRLTTGDVAVTGSGVKVVVDDAPDALTARERVLDEDLQKLANALWASGAEAISINGQRLTGLGAIRLAGTAITVNGVSLARPYTVLAIGNPDTMPARFVETTHGQEWLTLRNVLGLRFTITEEESLRVPAAKRLHIRHTRVEETP